TREVEVAFASSFAVTAGAVRLQDRLHVGFETRRRWRALLCRQAAQDPRRQREQSHQTQQEQSANGWSQGTQHSAPEQAGRRSGGRVPPWPRQAGKRSGGNEPADFRRSGPVNWCHYVGTRGECKQKSRSGVTCVARNGAEVCSLGQFLATGFGG